MDNKKQRWLFFGSANCNTCQKLLKEVLSHFDFTDIDMAYIDSFAEDKQNLCDLHGVDALPHIKIFSASGQLAFEYIGYISASEIELRLINRL